VDSNTGAACKSVIARRFGFTAGRIESLKWLGLGLMFAEHWMRYVTGALPHWAYLGGRAAFPLFVFALALGLSGAAPATLGRVLLRTLAWAVVAQAGLWLLEPPPLSANVLFTFALGMAAALAVQRLDSAFLLALILAAIGALGFACEFGPIGVAFVAGAILLARKEDPPVLAWVAVALVLAALALPNGSHFALASIPMALAIRQWGPELPRVRGAFYRAYALQFPVYAAARWAIA
jgi:hypothetical protein